MFEDSMPLVAKFIYHRPNKILHPYYVQIANNPANPRYYRRVFATLEEAIKSRDEFLAFLCAK